MWSEKIDEGFYSDGVDIEGNDEIDIVHSSSLENSSNQKESPSFSPIHKSFISL